jgi:predicted nucleotidyltransferase
MPRKSKKSPKISILEEAEALLKVLYWFFGYPDRPIGLSDLAEAVGISKTTANRIVTRLASEGFLQVEVMGKIWRITPNPGHPYNLGIKIPFNLGLVYGSGIVDEIVNRIPNARAIVLFGSYRKGDDADKSDLDIAVEVIGDEELRIVEFGKIPMGYREEVPVKLHIFSRNRISLNLFANIANGIVLHGFLEVRP